MTESDGVHLLVPIHIDALVVGEKGYEPDKDMFQWTDLAPDFSQLETQDPQYHFGSELVANGNPFAEAGALDAGIHLHFRLPRALTHGKQERAAKLTFPPIPNRWLVQRFGGSDKLAYKAWLIESDSTPEGSPPGITWPIFHTHKAAEFGKIGACTELTGPFAEQDQTAKVTLTAVGPGNPAFAAYYPACRGVLGFHDSLADVSEGTRLSYLVTGWYSDPNDDPLCTFFAEYCKRHSIDPGKLSPDQREQHFTELKWLEEPAWDVEGDPPAGFSSAARLLCHGLVRGITWHGPEYDYWQPAVFPDKHEKTYKLGVGNTAAEAVAALLKPGEVDQDLLTALQADLLSQPITAADLQCELHERRFSNVPGGTVFLIRQEPDPPGNNRAAQPLKSGGANPIPASLRKLLRELNTKQRTCDELARCLEDLRWQVFALWYLWTNENRSPGSEDKVVLLEKQLDKAKAVLKNEQTAWNTAKAERDASKKSLEAELGKYPKDRPGTGGTAVLEYRLASSPAPPFQRPSDPAIAVQGTAMTRLNTWSPAGILKCRISGQEVTAIQLAIVGGAHKRIQGKDLIEALFSQPEKLVVANGIHRSLLLEALLLDEHNAQVIAGRASARDADEKDLTRTVKALQNPKSTDAQMNAPGPPNELIGRLPDQSFPVEWQGNPWIPIYLVWEASWRSDYPSPGSQYGVLPQDLLTMRWDLDHKKGRDLILKEQAVSAADSSEKAAYQGYSILTSSVASSLADRLEALDPSHPLVNILKNQRALVQALDGFNDALLLQQSGMQLPPLDYYAWLDSDVGSYQFDPIHGVINDGFDDQRDTFRTVPRASNGPFHPILAGRLQIERLSIVDAFGQTLILPVEQINESAAQEWEDRMLRRARTCLAGRDDPTRDDPVIALRPRFAQPMRVEFEAEDASADAGEQGGPVCGWILPNHLEKSLTIYAASGKPLGALQKKLGLKAGSGEHHAFYWRDVPGVKPATIENAHLLHFKEWAEGLIPDDGNAFSACIDAVMATTDERVPEEDPGVAVLVGRPLALVRASIRFERAGLPAHRPELRPDCDESESVDDILETGGFLKVKCPLRLGDLGARNDGLIGAFRCTLSESGGGVISGGAFYPAWGQDRLSGQVGVFATQDFEIDAVVPLQLTLLMDPQARVHATTGVLPRVYLELPPEDVTGARRAREVFFQTAPVLGLSAVPEMPRPSDDYGEWSWAYRPNVTHWKLDPAIVEATDRAAFCDAWPVIAEGWLKLAIASVKVLSLWVRESAVVAGADVHLAWSLRGAEKLKLERVGKEGAPNSLIEEWNEPPFPREYRVPVPAETTYQLTAYAEDAVSTKELIITPEPQTPKD